MSICLCVVHAHAYAHLWRPKLSITSLQRLPLLFSTLLPWDRVFHWTRSSPFWLGWLASELSACLHSSQCWGYIHTQPCLAFYPSARIWTEVLTSTNTWCHVPSPMAKGIFEVSVSLEMIPCSDWALFSRIPWHLYDAVSLLFITLEFEITALGAE